MGAIKTSTGLASGIDTATLINALLVNYQNVVTKLQGRLKKVESAQTGLSQIQAGLLSLATPAQQLASKTTFSTLQTSISDPAQLSVSTNGTAAAGTYSFQTVQLATKDQSISKGFSDANTALGLSGDLVIGTGGNLSRPTSLDLLNNGTGVSRGSIKITDRSGASAIVDLSNALTVNNVVSAINSQTAISVQASTSGGKIVLQDGSGQVTNNLTVTEVNGGTTATDLGIQQSVASSTLTGNDVYQVSGDVPLSVINDGNGIRLISGVPDLKITLSDGTNLQIDLNSAKTVNNVVQAINTNSSNGGKLTAALTNGRLTLTDNSGGVGTLSVSNLNGSNAAHVLGLDTTASGNVLTGNALSGGLDSVLLRNLRGGQGITTLGQVSLTDRTGATGVIDLSNATSLDDVISAINSATTAGSQSLQLHATLDSRGTGIVVTDTSGQTASNLVISDVGGGSVATDLNIVVDDAVSSVSSGSLGLQSVNEATLLKQYHPSSGSISNGSFSITNSAGTSAIITITSGVKTVGDVIDQINSTGINVTAKLNSTGNGFVITDESGGSGTLTVQDISGTPAIDLHLTGTATTDGNGHQQLSSRVAEVIHVTTDDTLTTLSTKINSAGGLVRSSVVDSGATVNPYRLSLTSNVAGSSGQLIIDDGSLGFNFSKQTVGQDAVLRIGSNPATAFLKTSSSNTFTDAVTGYNVTLLQASTTPATVTGSLDTGSIGQVLSTFVSNYNKVVDTITTQTAYDVTTSTRAALQGDATVLQITPRILSLVNAVTGSSSSSIRSLADVGVTVTSGGKLQFDETVFQLAIANNPSEVSTLFSDNTSGFGKKLNDALNQLNDSTTGILTLENNANSTNAEQLQNQIDKENTLMANKKAYLEQKFANMETILSGLTTQQTALTALSQLITGSISSSKSN